MRVALICLLSLFAPAVCLAGDGHQFAAGAARAPARCEVRVVPGDHHSCKPEAIRQITELVRNHKPQ